MSDKLPRRRAHPTSVRFWPEERLRIERDAGGMSLTSYIRWRLLHPDNPPPKQRGNFPVKDHVALAQLLGLLGQSRLANNINQLARAANTGTLPVGPETEAELRQAAEDMFDARKEGPPPRDVLLGGIFTASVYELAAKGTRAMLIGETMYLEAPGKYRRGAPLVMFHNPKGGGGSLTTMNDKGSQLLAVLDNLEYTPEGLRRLAP